MISSRRKEWISYKLWQKGNLWWTLAHRMDLNQSRSLIWLLPNKSTKPKLHPPSWRLNLGRWRLLRRQGDHLMRVAAKHTKKWTIFHQRNSHPTHAQPKIKKQKQNSSPRNEIQMQQLSVNPKEWTNPGVELSPRLTNSDSCVTRELRSYRRWTQSGIKDSIWEHSSSMLMKIKYGMWRPRTLLMSLKPNKSMIGWWIGRGTNSSSFNRTIWHTSMRKRRESSLTTLTQRKPHIKINSKAWRRMRSVSRSRCRRRSARARRSSRKYRAREMRYSERQSYWSSRSEMSSRGRSWKLIWRVNSESRKICKGWRRKRMISSQRGIVLSVRKLRLSRSGPRPSTRRRVTWSRSLSWSRTGMSRCRCTGRTLARVCRIRSQRGWLNSRRTTWRNRKTLKISNNQCCLSMTWTRRVWWIHRWIRWNRLSWNVSSTEWGWRLKIWQKQGLRGHFSLIRKLCTRNMWRRMNILISTCWRKRNWESKG